MDGLLFSGVGIVINKRISFYSASNISAESEQVLTLNHFMADQLYSW